MTHMIATSILHLHLEQPKYVVFKQMDDDPSVVLKAYTYPHADWEDIGCPDTITLTVNPGDHLNP